MRALAVVVVAGAVLIVPTATADSQMLYVAGGAWADFTVVANAGYPDNVAAADATAVTTVCAGVWVVTDEGGASTDTCAHVQRSAAFESPVAVNPTTGPVVS